MNHFFMASESNKAEGTSSPPPNRDEKREVVLDGIDDRSKTPRHPRWTRQETFILIQGKKDVENRAQRGRRSALGFGTDQLEPKWDAVASYCKENGVNRGPVQCRKRWSNLLGDFKKIKTWESQIKGEAESFWVMRNDLRKERKLPGFFDREVYDVLDGRPIAAEAVPLTMIMVPTYSMTTSDGVKAVPEEEEEDEDEEAEALFDSGRNATAEDGLFSDFEQSGQEEAGWSFEKETIVTDSPTKTVTTPLPVPDKQHQPSSKEYTDGADTVKEKHPSSNNCKESMSQERCKRRRLSFNGSEDSTNLGDKLIKVLERNSSMMNAHFEAQNVNCQLEREQQKEQTDSIVAAISKLTDALVRIADKL